MARGTALSEVLLMVKAELGYNLATGVATQQDQELYWRIANKQQWLASQYDWPFLDTTGDATVSAGTRFLDLPLSGGLPMLNYDRPVTAYVNWNDTWQELGYGIGINEYNFINSEASPAETCDPIRRWNTNDNTQFEVWPVPVTTQVVRFAGQRPLNSLKTAGVFDAAKTLDLDDQLVTLFVAADLLMRQKNADAQLKLDEAQNRLSYLRAAGPSRKSAFILGGRKIHQIKRIVLVAGSGAGRGIITESGTPITIE